MNKPEYMNQQIASLALVVRDYDEAIDFYTKVLHFVLLEDSVMTETKRWVRIAPPGSQNGCSLLLARAVGPEQESRIGNQTGGRVFLFLHTDHLERDYQNLQNHGVKILRGPSEETYGKVLVFEDLYGNLWDLIEPKKGA